MTTYKTTIAADGRDITPFNFYRKSAAGRKNTAQRLANDKGEPVLLINTNTGNYKTFTPKKEG